MYKEIHGLKLYYEKTGQGDQIILCLHGWGCDHSYFDPIIQALQNDFTFYAIDFPAHGLSEKPHEPWSVADFSDQITEFLKTEAISQCTLIGHSFGARVAIVSANRHPEMFVRMILTGAAGIKKKKTPEQKKREKNYKKLKKIAILTGKIPLLGKVSEKFQRILRNKFGSADYNALDEDMRQTFVNIVSEDLKPLLHTIECPTLLVWGENDTETPLWMGKQMEKEIPDAGLVVFEQDDHFAYLHQWKRFSTIINAFMQ